VASDLALLAGYNVRRPTEDDFAAVAAFLAAATAAEFGEPDYPEETLRDDWDELDLDADAWLVLALDGGIAGYAALYHQDHVALEADGYVATAHEGRGIGTYLVRVMEARAGEHVPLAPHGIRVVLDNTINTRNLAARRLLEGEGYVIARYFWRMAIDLDEPPPPPEWPAGITVRTWQSDEDDYPAYLAIEEAFRDHWGHVPTDFATWRRKGSRFDPELCFLAFDGEEIAGAAVCRDHLGAGLVSQLGVRRPWRRRGLGLALLRQAFAAFHHRGWPRAILDVDAESETGATRLYERAGMRVDSRGSFASCRKELRPGAEYVAPDEDD
jgi:mycothiol synthase